MSAALVLGQMSFTTGGNSTTPNGLSQPHGLAFDGSGNLWVADSYNSRILEFSPPFSSGMAASVTLGEPGFGNGACPGVISASTMCFPSDLRFDSDGDLWIVDPDENRILEFKPLFSSGESTALVIGQPGFMSATQGAGATGFDYPWSLSFDKTGNLWVSDRGNWRVLEFTPPFSNGESANIVLGYPSFTATGSNTDPETDITNPSGLAFDRDGRLYVVDTGGSRVLIFAPPFSNGMSASGVIGQPNLQTVGAMAAPPTASGLANPVGETIEY
jgi:sugar lactone lactonase YvrE